VQDVRYRSLLEKEYRFCQQIQKGIIEKAERIYTAQKETGKIYPFYCDFVALEKACDAWTERRYPGSEGACLHNPDTGGEIKYNNNSNPILSADRHRGQPSK
jgi:hypothetical protein